MRSDPSRFLLLDKFMLHVASEFWLLESPGKPLAVSLKKKGLHCVCVRREGREHAMALCAKDQYGELAGWLAKSFKPSSFVRACQRSFGGVPSAFVAACSVSCWETSGPMRVVPLGKILYRYLSDFGFVGSIVTARSGLE
jgi:hypothetical protein